MSQASSSSDIIQPWQSQTDAVLAAHDHHRVSPTMWTILGMFGAFVCLAPFMQFDRVVTSSQGKIVAIEPLSTFQALDPSIIKSIDVKEGEELSAGQLLATLDPTFAAADVDQLRRQLAGLDAQISRNKAEQSHTPFDMVSEDRQVAPLVALQHNLFTKRQAQLEAQTRSFEEKIKTVQASIVRIEAERSRLEEREQIARKIEEMHATLYKSGSSSLLNKLQADDSHLEMQRTLEGDSNSLIELNTQLQGLQSDREAAIHQWYSSGSEDLVDAERQRSEVAGNLEKAVKATRSCSVGCERALCCLKSDESFLWLRFEGGRLDCNACSLAYPTRMRNPFFREGYWLCSTRQQSDD